ARLSKGKYFVTDKLPHNFRFIPLICSAFPEAKIIHVQRDKAATCWSNFKHNFVSSDLGYACDLKDTLEYYQLYEDLMQVWDLEHGEKIHKLVYEELTTDQEGTTKHLIDYLGLDWEDNCLSPQKNKRGVRTASQQQVRRSIYTGSSEAWKQYGRFIDNLFDQL
ncbi:MAG: sulfotransferase, partial [Alphaproteobacteria bacterium]